MDHLVLIPQDFNLVVTSEKLPQDIVTVWSNQRIPQGAIFYPFQGTVRIDKLNVFSTISEDDIRHRYGLYDEITNTEGRKVRNCNWIRFLRSTDAYGPQVNIVCTK
ncbi:hypothetical protein PVAND_012690 [Polypedilum vanderplanki]|uniref:Uncharacterized protein n=1 Tax=Polypedilum vanderplanki TaxID=319348 RepID=A0A9J6CP72_POLVA|nr:hypothetical protein PVAND_012690 [Polypedilum vanderplanki]